MDIRAITDPLLGDPRAIIGKKTEVKNDPKKRTDYSTTNKSD